MSDKDPFRVESQYQAIKSLEAIDAWIGNLRSPEKVGNKHISSMSFSYRTSRMIGWIIDDIKSNELLTDGSLDEN